MMDMKQIKLEILKDMRTTFAKRVAEEGDSEVGNGGYCEECGEKMEDGSCPSCGGGMEMDDDSEAPEMPTMQKIPRKSVAIDIISMTKPKPSIAKIVKKAMK